MNLLKKISFFFISLIAVSLIGCSPNNIETSSNQNSFVLENSDGKYDSFYPKEETSEHLEKIINSVKMINSIAFYEVYYLNKEENIQKAQLNNAVANKKYSSKSDFTNTASGTATIIFTGMNRVGLITCAHIVDMPDTLITYYREKDGSSTDFVESFGVKKSQSNYVVEFPGSGNIEVVVSDRLKDIAYLVKEFEDMKTTSFSKFNYSIGDATELNWGTFTYVIGYPLNFRMVSRAIVSSPTKDYPGAFLLDAVFNRGMSGGIILAMRDGVPNFEFVGMVQSVPGDREFFLVPPKKNSKLGYSNTVPYEGDVYVEEFKNLKYGITKVVTINSIISFIEENESILKDKGFFPTDLIKK